MTPKKVSPEAQRIFAHAQDLLAKQDIEGLSAFLEEAAQRDIGTCQMCGSYGWLRDKCVNKHCKVYGSLYC